jgi:hypothetical protein
MSEQLNIKEYSEKAFVIYGNSKAYKEQLMARRGKWNPNLIGGSGWIFSKKHMDNMKVFVDEVNKGMIPTPFTRKTKIPRMTNTVQTSNKKRKIYDIRDRNINDNLIIELEKKIEDRLRKEFEVKMLYMNDKHPTVHTPSLISDSILVSTNTSTSVNKMPTGKCTSLLTLFFVLTIVITICVYIQFGDESIDLFHTMLSNVHNTTGTYFYKYTNSLNDMYVIDSFSN